MKVVIRRSPPLMILRRSHSGPFSRATALALALGAIAAAYRSVVLLAADLSGSAPVTGSVVDRWHLWLAISLLCAAGASASWGVAQRPRKRE